MIEGLKPYPAYKDSGVEWLEEVPEHWEVRRLRASIRECTNGVWGSDPDGTNDIPCVRVQDFDRFRRRVRMRHPTLRCISPNDRTRRLLHPGDLLIEKSGGGDQQPVGMVVLYTHNRHAVCSNFIAKMSISEGYDSHFLNYLHSTLYCIELNIRSIKQTTGIQNLDSKSYLGELVAFPPRPEQTAIVRFLDWVDRRVRRVIRARRKRIKLLEEYKQALIHQAVTGQIDVRTGKPYPAYKDSGVEWLGKVPEHWEVRRVGAIASVGNGSTPLRSRPEYWSGGSFPWLNSSCVNLERVSRSDQFVTMKAISECHLPIVEPGSVLVAITGQGKTRGKSAVLEIKATINQHLAYLKPRPEHVTSDWLHLSMVAAYLELRSISDGIGGTKGALTCAELKRFRIATPPIEEQLLLAAFTRVQATKIDAAIAADRRMIELLDEFRTRLVADVVTGKVDVREVAARLPEEEPEPDDLEPEEDEAADEPDAEDPGAEDGAEDSLFQA